MLSLEDIKKYSLEDYINKVIVPKEDGYYSSNIDFMAVSMIKCPLHYENTPSFKYFQDTNTFYCFGCNRGGDIFNLHKYYVEKQVGEFPSFNNTVAFLSTLIQGSGKVQDLYQSPSNSNTSLSEVPKYKLSVDDYLELDNISSKLGKLNINNLNKYKLYHTLLSLIDLGTVTEDTFRSTLEILRKE